MPEIQFIIFVTRSLALNSGIVFFFSALILCKSICAVQVKAKHLKHARGAPSCARPPLDLPQRPGYWREQEVPAGQAEHGDPRRYI